jgi:hypothetical protein
VHEDEEALAEADDPAVREVGDAAADAPGCARVEQVELAGIVLLSGGTG